MNSGSAEHRYQELIPNQIAAGLAVAHCLKTSLTESPIPSEEATRFTVSIRRTFTAEAAKAATPSNIT